MDTREFLNRLSQKLNTGNRRSILLNAIPGRFNSRIDLTDIEEQLKGNSSGLIQNILNENYFEYSFSTRSEVQYKTKSNKIEKKLNIIYYQDIDNFLEQGVKSFGFGFPILVMKDPKESDKFIAAPIFIWKLELEKSSNTWIIKREVENKIISNDVLLSSLKSNGQPLSEDVLSRSEFELVDKEDLVEICRKIANELGFDFQGDKLNKCPTRENVIKSTVDKWISWSGVFGLYSLQRQSINNDLEEINSWTDKFEFNTKRSYNFQNNILSGVVTDPSQEQIINTLTESSVKVIQGPPGTGKSQSLSAIITNALTNGAKCLVVCEKKTALDVIYQNLEDIGLQDLCVIIDDPNKDRDKVVLKARNIIDDDNTSSYHRDQDFKINLEHFQKLIKEINNKHHLFLKRTFGDDSFKILINKIIKKDDSKDWINLSEKLPNEHLDFSFENFQILSGKIENCLQKIKKLKIKCSCFEDLNANIFKVEYSEQMKEQIISSLELIIKSGKEYKEYYKIQLNIFGYQLASFNQSGIKKLKRTAIFSKQKRSLLNEITTLNFVYSKFENLIFNEEILNNSKIITKELNLENKLSKTEKIIDCCNNILSFMDKFEDYYVYRLAKNQLSDKEKQILEYLITLPQDSRFSSFEKWYLTNYLTELEKAEGFPLCSSKPLRTLISINKSLKDSLKDKIYHYWKTKQRKSIKNFIDIKGNIKTLYNLKSGKRAHFSNSLRKITHKDLELFTDIFPVLLMNPISCSSILPMKKDFFEFVIFDEASQLKLEDTIPAYLRGKIRIVSGDSQQMPPSNYFQEEIIGEVLDDMNEFEEAADLAESESLLDFAESLSTSSVSYLDFHYRSRHPDLINFSNAAFYNNRLVPMPEKPGTHIPITFYQLSGKNLDGTNVMEVKQIIKILFNDIKKKADNSYPSVGIATMNIKQRNLIWDEISRYCISNNSAFDKLRALEKSGFFVKNLENIQGDERDIIIISTTYGTNEEGIFKQNFGPIGKDKGYRLLNVIITRAKYQIFICTSIPKNYYLKYKEEIEKSGISGKGIFYAYLTYAESVSKGSGRQTMEILDFITSMNSGGREVFKKLPKRIEENNIIDYIVDYIDADRIVQNTKLGGIDIPLIIKSPTKDLKYIVLEIEGDKFQLTREAYLYDIYRQDLLNKLGFQVYHIWLYNWWKNPKKEVIKLVKFLENLDGQFYNF